MAWLLEYNLPVGGQTVWLDWTDHPAPRMSRRRYTADANKANQFDSAQSAYEFLQKKLGSLKNFTATEHEFIGPSADTASG